MEYPHKTQAEDDINKTNESEQVVDGEAENADKSKKTETDNETDKVNRVLMNKINLLKI